MAVCLLTIGGAGALLFIPRVPQGSDLPDLTGSAGHVELHPSAVSLAVLLLAAAGVLIGAGLFVERRRRVELHARHASLEAALDAFPGGIATVDGVGRIRFFGPKAERMFSMTAAEARGQDFTALFAEEALPEINLLLAQVRAKKSESSSYPVLMGRRRDGRGTPIELHLGRSALGEGAGFVVFMRDLTGRRSAEQQAENATTELLHMSRLINMGELAASLAHELNQPLAALSAYLESATRLLARVPGNRDGLLVHAVENATAQAMRAGNVIRRMREFVARGETEKRVESVASMVKEALALAVFTEEGREVGFDLACDPMADLVLANKIQIQQVLLNILRNGIESMKDTGSRRLRITSEALSNGMIRISIADTGSGIAPEVAATLFQPFMTTKEHGLGVGLSISRTIVESHGGRLSAEANPGGGTIFRFTLRSGSFMEAFEEDGV